MVAESPATNFCLRDGTWLRGTNTCGPRCRPFAAARSIVRFVPCGARMAKSRGRGPPTSWCEEIVDLRRRGFRFIALADDNFYPVSLDRSSAGGKAGKYGARCRNLQGIRAERFELMSKLAQLPSDMVFFTQITMEAGEDTQFLDAMRKANIKGALVGVESATARGSRRYSRISISPATTWSSGCRRSRNMEFTFWDRSSLVFPRTVADTFAATAELAKRADITFAQFVMLTPFPGTMDFDRWEKNLGEDVMHVGGIPITRHWLIPAAVRPKMFSPHRTMSSEEIRERTQGVWDSFYSMPEIWKRSKCVPTSARPSGISFHFQAVSADVRQDRNFNRQRPSPKGNPHGALAGDSMPQAF